jgi:hypothetical protein
LVKNKTINVIWSDYGAKGGEKREKRKEKSKRELKWLYMDGREPRANAFLRIAFGVAEGEERRTRRTRTRRGGRRASTQNRDQALDPR